MLDSFFAAHHPRNSEPSDEHTIMTLRYLVVFLGETKILRENTIIICYL